MRYYLLYISRKVLPDPMWEMIIDAGLSALGRPFHPTYRALAGLESKPAVNNGRVVLRDHGWNTANGVFPAYSGAQ
jgi:hypothetical protein